MNMRVQTLVSTMYLNDTDIIKKMNIKTDAIIINQTNDFGYEEFIYDKYKAKIYSFNERGIGLSRNSALMRATSDICILADDDCIYFDDAAEKIKMHFWEDPELDVLIYNIEEEVPTRYIIEKEIIVNKYNYMRYGAVRIAFKLDSIIKKNIFFHQMFGGGAKYGSGEDTLFLKACLDAKLKVKGVPDYILRLTNERPSTWFNGYDKKFFQDKGALFKLLSPKYSEVLALRFCLKRYKLFKHNFNIKTAFMYMKEGMKDF